MDKNVSKHGTDAKYPIWMGGRIDPKFVNGATAIAILINVSAVLIHMVAARSGFTNNWNLESVVFVGLAMAICAILALTIRHSDRFTQNFIRFYSCGLPLIAHFGLIYLGFFPS